MDFTGGLGMGGARSGVCGSHGEDDVGRDSVGRFGWNSGAFRGKIQCKETTWNILR